jgi:hypothetical protein
VSTYVSRKLLRMLATLSAQSKVCFSDFEPTITTFPVENIIQTGPSEVVSKTMAYGGLPTL